MAKFEAARSEQARYLAQCVGILRRLQRANSPVASTYISVCRHEAALIISGDYCNWAAK